MKKVASLPHPTMLLKSTYIYIMLSVYLKSLKYTGKWKTHGKKIYNKLTQIFPKQEKDFIQLKGFY
jgi:hypothetical protein